MQLTRPALGRPMDWSYVSNRFIVAVTPVVGSIGGLVALIRGEGPWDAVGWGVSSGGVSFLAWAVAREIHPDRTWVATAAAFIAPAGMIWGRPDLLATATILLAARSVAGTTGRAPRISDLLLFAAVGVPIVWRSAGPAALAVAAIALMAAIVWADRRRAVAVTAALLHVSWMASAVLLADGLGLSLGDDGPAFWALLAVGAVTLVGPGRMTSIEDRRDGAPLRPGRVRAARLVVLAAAAAMSLTVEPGSAAALWGALAGVALRPR